MKYLVKGVFKALFIFAFISTAHAFNAKDIDYYLGVNGQWTNTTLASDWKTVFKDKHPGANVYFGLRPIEHFGVELGYSWSTHKPKRTAVANSESFGGLTNSSGSTINVDSKLRLLSTNLDFIGYLPLENSFELMGYVGVGWARFRPTFSLSASGSNLDSLSEIKVKTSAYLRLGAGVQRLLTENLGVKLKLDYSDLGRVRFRNSGTVNFSPEFVKRAYTVGLGLYYYV